MKQKILKVVYWVIGVTMVILAILYFLGVYGYRIQNYFIEKSQEEYLANIERNKAALLEMQKNDTYGGKTPEETLDLYISALKAGDIELASKYSEISVEKSKLQDEELRAYKEALERDGDLHVVLGNMNNIVKKGKKNIWSDTKVSFVYSYITKEQSTSTSVVSGEEIITVYPKGIEEHVGVSLRLNPYTKVWKIIQ
jgi:hypothetical protein